MGKELHLLDQENSEMSMKNTYRQSLRETAHRLCIALLCVILSAGQVFAGSMTLLGAGGPAAAGVTYTGPGDTVSGAVTYYSCARALNATYANGTNSLCDLVDSAAPTVVICTLRVKTNGFVDLTGAYCTGSVTPATKCAAATGGTCNISKAYNQVSPGTNDVVNVTASAQPKLGFSALNGLPGFSCVMASTSNLATSTTITQAQPWTLLGVSERTALFTTLGGIIGESTAGTITLEYTTSANTVNLQTGTVPTQTASDSAFHSIIGVGATGAQFVVVDGTAGSSGGAAAGTIGNVMRICRTANSTSSMTGIIMEAGLWSGAFNSTNYGAMNTNQHSATNGYNF